MEEQKGRWVFSNPNCFVFPAVWKSAAAISKHLQLTRYEISSILHMTVPGVRLLFRTKHLPIFSPANFYSGRRKLQHFSIQNKCANAITSLAALSYWVSICYRSHGWLTLHQITFERSNCSHQCDGWITWLSHYLVYRARTHRICIKVLAWRIALSTWPHVPCHELCVLLQAPPLPASGTGCWPVFS